MAEPFGDVEGAPCRVVEPHRPQRPNVGEPPGGPRPRRGSRPGHAGDVLRLPRRHVGEVHAAQHAAARHRAVDLGEVEPVPHRLAHLARPEGLGERPPGVGVHARRVAPQSVDAEALHAPKHPTGIRGRSPRPPDLSAHGRRARRGPAAPARSATAAPHAARPAAQGGGRECPMTTTAGCAARRTWPSVVDLGATPPCERFLTAEQLDEPEPTYPLHLRVCTDCWLAQLPPLITPEETFTEYAYFSSYSTSWVEHARGSSPPRSTGWPRPGLVRGRGGQQRRLPAAARGRAGRALPGHRAVGERRRGGPGAGRAHADRVPHPGDRRARCAPSTARPTSWWRTTSTPTSRTSIGFTEGLRALVADDGWVSIEVQHLLTLMELNQYDTIYHEHFQYYTVASAQRALAARRADAGRRRAAADARRLDPAVGAARRGGAASRRAGGRRAGPEKAAGLHELSGLRRASRPGSPRSGGTCCASSIEAAEAGPHRGRLRRARQGQHAAQPLRRPARPARRTRWTATRTSTAGSPRARASRSCRRSGSPADRPDYVLVLPWNLRDELDRPAVLRPRVGRPAGLPHPDLEVVS